MFSCKLLLNVMILDMIDVSNECDWLMILEESEIKFCVIVFLMCLIFFVCMLYVYR